MSAPAATIGSDRTLGNLALLNALVVVALFASAILAGISQEPFQIARAADLNVARLLQNPTGLRINVGLDNLFIVTYCTFFALLAVRLKPLLDPLHLGLAFGAILLTALLDAIENQHILVMLFSAEQNLPISVGETQVQMIASSVKFHANYVASALFAFGFYRLAGLGRPIALLLWLAYVPLGLAIFMVPAEFARPLIIARTLFFIAAFLMIATMFWQQAHRAVKS